MINLFLSDEINGLTSKELINSMNSAVANGEKSITIHINSGGGSVFDGFGIINAILTLQNEGIEINTHVAGIGGSMAGVIAMFGDKVTMNDFSLLMIHNPFKQNGEPTPDEQKVIDKIKVNLRNIFVNRRGMSETDVDEKMSAETWFDSSDAINSNLVDEVIFTGVTVENKIAENIFEIANNYQFDKSKLDSNKIINMKDICNKIGIEETENVSEIQNGIDKFVDSKVAEFKNEIEEKDAKIKELNDELLEGKKAEAELVIDDAIENGKIKAESKESWLNKMIENKEETTELLNSIELIPANIMDNVDTSKEDENEEIENNKDFDHYMNNGGVADLIKNDWEKYAKLYEDKFGKEPIK